MIREIDTEFCIDFGSAHQATEIAPDPMLITAQIVCGSILAAPDS